MSQEVVDHHCSKCGKECKDPRGRKVHEARCTGDILSSRCESCNQNFSNIYSMQRHRLTCSILLKTKSDLEIEEKFNKTRFEYEEQIKVLENEVQRQVKRYDSLLNETSENADRLYKENKLFQQKILTLQDDNNALQEKLRQTTEDIRNLSLELARHTNKYSTNNCNNQTYNINNLNHSQNQNNFFIQAFDYAQCINKIKPPNNTVFSIPDMVNLLFDSGFGNHIRTTDRSRNAMIWNKPEIGQIRDSNGNDISNYLFDQFQDKIESQQEYVERELNKLIASDYPNDSLIEAKRKHIEFCREFKNKDRRLIDKLRKEIGKRAKDVKDDSIDEVKRSKFNKILVCIEKELFPEIGKWITLSFEQFGAYMGKVISEHYWIEGASAGSEDILPYIIGRDDNKKICKITHQELGELLFLLMFEKFNHKESRQIILCLIETWLKEKKINNYEEEYNRSLELLQAIEKKEYKALNLILKGLVAYKQK
jgi:hypothetical protein